MILPCNVSSTSEININGPNPPVWVWSFVVFYLPSEPEKNEGFIFKSFTIIYEEAGSKAPEIPILFSDDLVGGLLPTSLSD